MTPRTGTRSNRVDQSNKRKRDESEKSEENRDVPQTKRMKVDQPKTQTRLSSRKRAHDEEDAEHTVSPRAKKTKLSPRALRQVRKENARRLNNRQVWKQPCGLIDLNMKLKQDSTLNAIVMQNVSSSPLLRLPGEIRNQIYKELLTERVIKINRGKMEKKRQAWTQRWSTSIYRGQNIDQMAKAAPPPTFAVLSSCRQIYHEAASLFYKENTFAFDTEKDMTDWAASRLPAQLNAIKTIQAGPQLINTILARSIMFNAPKVTGMSPKHLANIKVSQGAPHKVFSNHIPGVKHVIANNPGCGSSAFWTAIHARDPQIEKVSVIPR